MQTTVDLQLRIGEIEATTERTGNQYIQMKRREIKEQYIQARDNENGADVMQDAMRIMVCGVLLFFDDGGGSQNAARNARGGR